MHQDERQAALKSVHRQMRVCRICADDGHAVVPQAIFSGCFGARMMTVGQAPGITEVEAGRPFNAGSGKRLFQWLEQAGIEQDWFRATQYMTSVTKCYPGRAKTGSGDRVPSPLEQRLCRPYLEQELALVNPALIIPIGKLAIEIFYPKGLNLTEIIGTQRQVDGRWVVPLPHSSGASRWHQAESNRQLIEAAIRLIAAHFQKLFPQGLK